MFALKINTIKVLRATSRPKIEGRIPLNKSSYVQIE